MQGCQLMKKKTECLVNWQSKFFDPRTILVPRGHARFGQHQESRPLAKSNTGSPRFTDFPSLCACSESSLTNLIGPGLNLLCLQSHSKTECRWTRPEVAILGADQKERGLWGRECPRTEKFSPAETTSGGSLGPPKKRSTCRN